MIPSETQTREAYSQVGGLGFRVDRDTESLPQGADSALFTITGGRVLLLQIVGEVTTVIGGANNTKLVFNPTATGVDQDLCAVLDIDADAVGELYTITGIVANAMRSDLLIGQGMTNPMVLSEGDIEINCAGSVTGAIQWSMWYLPLDSGATVAVS